MGTFTTRLNLFKPSGTPGSADAVDVAADLNAQYDIIDAAMGFQPLSSFPGSPYAGKGVIRTDQANMPFLWTGSLWAPVLTTLTAVKTADQSVNNSTAFVDVSDLTLTVEAPATYFMLCHFIFTCATSEAPDIQIKFPYSGSATGGWSPWGMDASATTDSTIIRTAYTTWASGSGRILGVVHGIDQAVIPHGLLKTSTAGTLKVQFGQAGASAQNTTFEALSSMTLLRLA